MEYILWVFNFCEFHVQKKLYTENKKLYGPCTPYFDQFTKFYSCGIYCVYGMCVKYSNAKRKKLILCSQFGRLIMYNHGLNYDNF